MNEQIRIKGILYKTNLLTGFDFWRGSRKGFEENCSQYGWLYVCDHVIESEVPESFDERKAKLQALEAAAKKVREEFNAKIERINTEISKLQAIEFEPGRNSGIDPFDGVPF